jgi:hypothetical protein
MSLSAEAARAVDGRPPEVGGAGAADIADD